MTASRLLTYAVAGFLALHGLVHLLGTAVYLELAEVPEFAYATTVLGGRVNLGETGIRVFGVLWAVAAAGFVASAVALVAEWRQWRTLLVAVTLLSLVLTVLDYGNAYAGIVVNLGILAGIWLWPRF